MPVHITIDQFTTFAANKWMDFQHPTDDALQRNFKTNAIKYNTLATLHNGSTVLAVALIVGAVVGSVFVGTAILWGGIGLFIRSVAERQIEVFARTDRPIADYQARRSQIEEQNRYRASVNEYGNGMNEEPEDELPLTGAVPGGIVSSSTSATSYLSAGQNAARRAQQIFENCGVSRPKGWVENEVSVFGYAAWKNLVPVPTLEQVMG